MTGIEYGILGYGAGILNHGILTQRASTERKYCKTPFFRLFIKADYLDVPLLREEVIFCSQYCCDYLTSTRSPFPRLCKQGVPREGEAGICIVEAICDACYALHP